MYIADSITHSNTMIKSGIVSSVAKSCGLDPLVAFDRIAKEAALLTSRKLGTRILFSDDAILVASDLFNANDILNIFRRCFVRAAWNIVGIA